MYGTGDESTLYDFYAYNENNQVWDGAAFVNWSDADYEDYRISAVQQGASGEFTANRPGGAVRWVMRERGATLQTSYIAGVGDIYSEQIASQTVLLGTAAAIGSSLSGIQPSVVYVTNRLMGTGVNYDIVSFVGEAHTVTIPSADFSGAELSVIFQELSTNRDVASIANASITKTSTTVAFAIPAKVRAKQQILRYSIRRVSNQENLIYGTWEVRQAAFSS